MASSVEEDGDERRRGGDPVRKRSGEAASGDGEVALVGGDSLGAGARRTTRRRRWEAEGGVGAKGTWKASTEAWQRRGLAEPGANEGRRGCEGGSSTRHLASVCAAARGIVRGARGVGEREGVFSLQLG